MKRKAMRPTVARLNEREAIELLRTGKWPIAKRVFVPAPLGDKIVNRFT